MGHDIELRAFRGTRRSSTYRSHTVAAEAAARLSAVAAEHDLVALASAAAGGETELGRRDARRLADETTRLRGSAVVLELDDELVAIAEVANWCGRATGRSWLQIKAVP